MKTYDYMGTAVSIEKGEYYNGTVALMLNDSEGGLYAVATVNLNNPLQSESMAFLDENNLPGIGRWIELNHLGVKMGVVASSGFCRYPLYMLF
ncbi:MAG: DUF4313 domain-containing protein [Bacteroidales bacterium]|nr:DUF4313 domain-containing protein [Bacteroidales bacterium]